MNTTTKKIAIIGSGPAGLMAASLLKNKTENDVHIFEKRSAMGRKLLIAGSSGLNITYDHKKEKPFHEYYRNDERGFLKKSLKEFSPENWIHFLEHNLELKTFLGTSRRYFVKEMKASGLLKNWTNYLKKNGVTFHTKKELSDFFINSKNKKILLHFNNEPGFEEFDVCILALGGAAWEKEKDLTWPTLLKEKGIKLTDFESSNCGYKVSWKKEFLKEVGRTPVKNVMIKTALGNKQGDIMITDYGIEGTPIYHVGKKGTCTIDLFPEISESVLEKKLSAPSKEKLSLQRLFKKYFKPSKALDAFIFHYFSEKEKTSAHLFSHRLKNLEIKLEEPQPLEEAISSLGGVKANELTDELMLKKYPGIYCVGEMNEWDAPTGGFLIQGCVSQGAFVAKLLL